MVVAVGTTGLWRRRVVFVLLVAFDARAAYAVIHASFNYHRDTAVFWASIALLCLLFLVVLWVLHRLARSLS